MYDWFSILGRSRDFFFSPPQPDRIWGTTQCTVRRVTGWEVCFPREVSRSKSDVNHLPPSRSEVNNLWGCKSISLLSIRQHAYAGSVHLFPTRELARSEEEGDVEFIGYTLLSCVRSPGARTIHLTNYSCVLVVILLKLLRVSGYKES